MLSFECPNVIAILPLPQGWIAISSEGKFTEFSPSGEVQEQEESSYWRNTFGLRPINLLSMTHSGEPIFGLGAYFYQFERFNQNFRYKQTVCSSGEKIKGIWRFHSIVGNLPAKFYDPYNLPPLLEPILRNVNSCLVHQLHLPLFKKRGTKSPPKVGCLMLKQNQVFVWDYEKEGSAIYAESFPNCVTAVLSPDRESVAITTKKNLLITDRKLKLKNEFDFPCCKGLAWSRDGMMLTFANRERIFILDME